MSKVPRRTQRPPEITTSGKYLSNSFRLSNNKIMDFHGLQYTLDHFLAEPSKLGWLDLSFNKLARIGEVLCELKELRVLYLHGNGIGEMSEVDKLGELEHLHVITLHGNIIEIMSGYRNHVISVLPHLKRMDFSSVTPEEKTLAKLSVVARTRKKKKIKSH